MELTAAEFEQKMQTYSEALREWNAIYVCLRCARRFEVQPA
jgi:hypothetical protein